MKCNKIKNSRGFTLLEMLLVMSIIAVILVGVTRYYEAASTSQKENDAIRLVQNLKAAGERYRIGKPESGDILEKLIARNLVPETSKTNPWGGTVGVSLAENNGPITVTLSAIPGGACMALVKIFTTSNLSSVPTCSAQDANSPGDFSINF
jgi:prepilin-type N-terminal cleavage/methylation domain-containing protein